MRKDLKKYPKRITHMMRGFFSQKLSFVVILLLVIALAVTILFAQTAQENRQHAATPAVKPTPPVKPITPVKPTPPVKPITPVKLTLERVEVAANNVSDGGATDYWGQHKSRIIRTSTDDIFFTYKTSATDFAVMHRGPGTRRWTQVYTGTAGYEPVNILEGANDSINVFFWPNDGTTLKWAHSADNGKTFQTDTIPGAFPGGQGYSGAGANSQGVMTVFKTGDYQPGEFAWAVYNPSTNQWQFAVTLIDYRYTYAFFLPGENGDLSITAILDVPQTTIAGCGSDRNVYIYTELKYYHIPDIFNPTQPTETVLKKEACHNPPIDSNTVDIIVYGTDSYLDTQGRIHVLYVDTNNGGAHHAIIQNGQVIKDVPVKVPDPYRDRIIQDTSGRFYLLGMHKGSSMLSIQSGTDSDTDGTHLAPPVSIDLGSKYPMTGWGTFRIASPRTGTALANYLDGHYQSGNSIIYFRVKLTDASPNPSRVLPSQPSSNSNPSETLSQIPSAMPTSTLPYAIPTFYSGDYPQVEEKRRKSRLRLD
jgi:hypothetical protein